MQVRLLLGPAGSGKTFRCLGEARQELLASPEGPPVLFIAPKQGTYQLEQQLLADPSLAGYTRLFILSFESLARFIFARLGRAVPHVLTEEGRLMVLRSLLTKTRQELKVFRASARLTGFAQQLNRTLSELQRAQLNPAELKQLAAQIARNEGLSCKLQDLGTLLERYLEWLAAQHLQDEDALLRAARKLLGTAPRESLPIDNVWIDGFAEFSELELELLDGLLPCCQRATITFCLEPAALQKVSWLSHWSPIRKSFERCQKKFGALADVALVIEIAGRGREGGRFLDNPVLRHLEESWADPQPYSEGNAAAGPAKVSRRIQESLRLVCCEDREHEVTLAAREILRFVRGGGRFREVSVQVRHLDLYHQAIRRVFSRYEIPFFLDRREPVSHHPLAELTRGSVRAAAFGWHHADWFGALKSGLVPIGDEQVDLIENEALARGWNGGMWHEPIRLKDSPRTEWERRSQEQLEKQLEQIRRAIVPPFEKFTLSLAALDNRPTGRQLAAAIRALWSELQVQRRLEDWAAAEPNRFDSGVAASVHETVWRQVNAWLDNAQLAFPEEVLALRDWLPILEAGLANLSVGIIPPALDQVLVGAVERSRTPEVKLALVLGWNESVFPAVTDPGGLLNESDRLELEKHSIQFRSTARYRLGLESYLGYIACTRACQRLVLTWALHDPAGAPLNPSSFLLRVRQLFPQLEPETAPRILDWRQTEHPSELVEPILRMRRAECPAHGDGTSEIPGAQTVDSNNRKAFGGFHGIASLFEILEQLGRISPQETLAPELAARLYGPVLRSSVSRLEQFAACPFRFFVHSGLRAEERKHFELDVREQGTFQHDVLALFHEQLRDENKLWRDLTPVQARGRVGKIAQALSASFREGLLKTSDENQFTARVLSESLQDFVETLVDWMRGQYGFDPVAVELPFGETEGTPGWSLDLGQGHRLELYGRIDRIDLCRLSGGDSMFCVVIDYKSSHKQLDPVLIEHGLQLQLLMYLNVLRRCPQAANLLGAARLEPAGVFYVNLRGMYGRETNRRNALADPALARKLAYRHSGRFDLRVLPFLDSRLNVPEGDQFNYRRTKSGMVSKVCKEPVENKQFHALLDQVERILQTMGRQVYAGHVEVSPYRKGVLTACDQCAYASICRVDPWTQQYRVLRRADAHSE